MAGIVMSEEPITGAPIGWLTLDKDYDREAVDTVSRVAGVMQIDEMPPRELVIRFFSDGNVDPAVIMIQQALEDLNWRYVHLGFTRS